MSGILLVYSSVDGHTREIAERLRARWEAAGQPVTLVSLDDDPAVDPGEFERVVIGASIRYGKHRPSVAAFMNRHADALRHRPAAFFSVSLVARKPNRDRLDTNPYVRRFLKTLSWQPDLVEVFAGKLDYPRYGFWDRQMIRLIMWMTKGPTDPAAVVDYTDWQRVDAFADALLAR
jgi:menaquinone-dependent protoporphyrinogen oxidase